MTITSENGKTRGRGAADADISSEALSSILQEALASVPPRSSVLAIIADKSRDDNTPALFPMAAQILSQRQVQKFDALVAQGTHSPMRAEDKNAKIGSGPSFRFAGYIFDHDWADPSKLVSIGTLSAERVRALSHGLMDQAIELRVNRLLREGLYDVILIFGETLPHEVAGFSGGAKYLFPGVSGPELTHATHWLGALSTIENTIGRIETPPRHLFEAAADFIPAKVISINSVVSRENDRVRTHALFCGDHREAVRRAAEISGQVHIKYTGRSYRRVIALLDEHYDDLWVGGKASYRIGPVIEEGGELLIYAPHLRTVSETHGNLIKKYGYAPLEKVKQLVSENRDLRENLCVAAHLAHVSFAGRQLADGSVAPKYSIVLASALDANTCRQLKLGYISPGNFRISDYSNDPDTLIVDQAGRDLYLVAPHANS